MKKQYIVKKLHNNNKGVTLVELIVSIGILSVVVAPLLYTFVYATRVNAQAKIKQRSLNTAQSIMEIFKANGLEDSHDLLTQQKKKTVTKEDGSTQEVAVPFLENNNTSATYSFTQSSGYYGTYEIDGIYLSDVTSASAETRKYDAVIDVSQGLVSSDVSVLDVYDPTVDFLFTEYDDNYGSYLYDPTYVANLIVEENNLNTYDVDKVIINHRDINLTFSDTAVSVTYSYNYTIKVSATATDSAYTINDVYTQRPAKTEKNYKSFGDGNTLRDIYFYYYPAYEMFSYNAGGSTTAYDFVVQMNQDRLYVTNNASKDVNIYLYKQVDSSRWDQPTSSSNYRTMLNLWASDHNYHLYLYNGNGTSTTCQKTFIYDCIKDNLYNVINSPHIDDTNTLFRAGDGHTDSHTLIYFDNSGSKYLNNIDYTDTSVTEIPLTTYVTIKIYDQKLDPRHTDAIATLSSTILN